ncbi:MAG TPA: Trp biosynthesis-associated membrane protein [Natronosporangium sp.]
MTGRRQLAITVGLCAVGAAAVLIAAAQTWQVEVSQRPAPLPALRDVQTGGALRPWLPAVGWVALAGAGALLALRGTARRLLGGLLLVAGVVIVPGALTVAGGWPVVAAVGGLAVAAAGAVTVLRSGRWPAMGARYERPAHSATAGHPDPGGQPDTTEQPDPAQLWQALDRGEDPTA